MLAVCMQWQLINVNGRWSDSSITRRSVRVCYPLLSTCSFCTLLLRICMIFSVVFLFRTECHMTSLVFFFSPHHFMIFVSFLDQRNPKNFLDTYFHYVVGSFETSSICSKVAGWTSLVMLRSPCSSPIKYTMVNVYSSMTFIILIFLF